jgi:hypothetical protein
MIFVLNDERLRFICLVYYGHFTAALVFSRYHQPDNKSAIVNSKDGYYKLI